MKTIHLIMFIIITVFSRPFPVELKYSPNRCIQFEKIVFMFSENLKFDNPFDLETNRVELLIEQPDSSRRLLSFFFNGVNAVNIEQWEARFTPKLSGYHRFTLIIDGKEYSRLGVEVAPNRDKRAGGLILSDIYGTFRFENGGAFRGIGMNVCWADDYEYYFRKMNSSKMNITRIWLCPWHLPFEWSKTGLGRYDLKSAQRLDTIIELARKYGIYIILCIDYHGVAQKSAGFFRENRWHENPYNKKNGGPCTTAASVFTDPTAKSYQKKKYKYIISRYGFSPNIAAWEFFNEADLTAGDAVSVNKWHIETAEYVKSIDIHRRLVSTSSTRAYVEKLVDAFRSKALDFVMFHDYNMTDVAPHIINLAELGREFYFKPLVIGEFGVEFRGAELTAASDPEHTGLHNGIWAGLFGETPLLPMSWWWDSYIDKLDLWHEFTYLSRFADSLDFNSSPLTFSSLQCNYLQQYPKSKSYCTVRCIRAGKRYALWFKNSCYIWSARTAGIKSETIGCFVQTISEIASGRYTVLWFDPQRGSFADTSESVTVGKEGLMSLSVPSFEKDIACLIKPSK